MKKLFTILVASVASVALLACSFNSNAQHTVPRFGTAPNQDKTFRNMTNGYSVINDTLGATKDTLKITPSCFSGNYILTLNDSCVLSIKSLGNSYVGDKFTVTIENTAGASHFVEFLNASGLSSFWGMASTGTKISLASGKSATLVFYFDGVLYNEVSRSIR